MSFPKAPSSNGNDLLRSFQKVENAGREKAAIQRRTLGDRAGQFGTGIRDNRCESEHVMFRRFGGPRMAIQWIKRDEARGGRNPEVRALIARHFEADIRRVTDAAHFVEDLGADWLDHLELLILIEEHFPGMQITEQDAEQLQTVGDLIRYITYWNQGSTATTLAPGALTTGASQA